MQTEMPFFENIEEALTACVQALGGAKVVGKMLWDDKSVDDARRVLLDCLNPSRNEKLKGSQMILIFRKAKEVGFHAGFNWFSQQCEYEARPLTKAEEVDRLTAMVEQASKSLSGALATLERIQRGQPMQVVK